MATSRPHKYDPYAEDVFDALMAAKAKGKSMTKPEIQAIVNKTAARLKDKRVPGAYSIVYHLRTVLGTHVIVCEGRRNAKYRIADSFADASLWITKRRSNIISQIERTEKAMIDTLEQFGPTMPAADIKKWEDAQTMLRSAHLTIRTSMT